MSPTGSDPSAGRTRPEAARAYYGALDGNDYELLGELLASGFVQERPDMRLEGRDRFVRFMREERPMTDTSHRIDAVYERVDGDEVVVRGRLLNADDELLVRFADVFSFEGNKMEQIRTFTA